VTPAPKEILEELYGAGLDAFVARRDELARSLRKEGKREEADAVKKLRKPSVAAWAVNALARHERPQVDALLEAGERLRDAHAKLLGGGPSRAVQDASREERKAVETLVDAAGRLLEEAGRSAGPATLDRVRDTLHAAASDERVRELVAEGRVVEDEEATGFAFAGLAPAKAKPAKARPPRPDAARERAEEKRRTAEERAGEARRGVKEAEQDVRAAERALAQAERGLKSRRSALERAERDLERAREALDRR